MNLLNQLPQVFKNFASLGQKRLMMLGGAAALAMLTVLFGALFINKPTYETLYVGLESNDLNKISIALAESKMDFVVGPDGTSVQVPVGMTSRARLVLAERGLPDSANAGYELFDNVGSLGLTSFMQEVTRVRALEGEIGRSIQQIEGVAAARVHIVLPDVGNFRRGEQKPTASVMIRASASAGRKAAASIRHLVASAVPGLEVDDVTLLDSTGQLLASGDDESNGALNRSLSLSQNVQMEIENKIDRALAPFLGMDNFRSSVTAQINTDSQQIQETVFDPESRVERSVRSTREEQKTQEALPENQTTVEQNVPQAAPQAGGSGSQSSDESARREEQTNYEINSKTVATVRNGYTIEKLSVAVVVNRGRIAAMVGEPVDQEKIDAYLAEMQKIVTTAAGITSDRGDVVSLTAMDFLETQLLNEAAASGPGVTEVLSRNSAGIINALAFVAVVFLVIWFVGRPMLKSAGGTAPAPTETVSDAIGLDLPDFSPSMSGTGGLMEGFGADFGFDSTDDLLSADDDGNFNRRVKEGPEKRLSRMVEISEERAAKILRKWAVEQAA